MACVTRSTHTRCSIKSGNRLRICLAGPVDSTLFYHYKNGMKYTRVAVSSVLAVSILGCSVLSKIPEIGLGPTSTPSQTFTPEPTFTPTITPTPLPTARVGVGDHAFFNGDYDTALVHYQTAYKDSPDPMIRAAAKWGEA